MLCFGDLAGGSQGHSTSLCVCACLLPCTRVRRQPIVRFLCACCWNACGGVLPALRGWVPTNAFQLQQWRDEFATQHGGKSPSAKDLAAEPLFKEFQELRRALKR